MAEDATFDNTPGLDHLEAGDITQLATEASNPASRNLDQLSALEIVRLMNKEDAGVAGAVSHELDHIAQAVDIITEHMKQGGRLIYMGAGTSGRLGVLDASECPPTFNTSPEQVIGWIAGGPDAMSNAVESAEDNVEMGRQDVINLKVTAKDAIVGLTASGRTPYVMGALVYARELGAAAIAVTCNRPAAVEEVADVTIALDTGPEVLAGSTRLKAGTAQKMVLNMLSTAVMVRLGKTYGNLMVDMRPTNAKLRRRAARIVAEATGVAEVTAAETLQNCDGETRTAIVSLLAGVSPEQARQRLEASGGFVRQAIKG
ncbi:MAG TPA: N-acetylmuramic acid 6-phosphate etherase [Chloroflexia bacterium]|nr:N-acetylmuramic acid 6-phosphate etherase [Chloroflexia bacterium]